MQFEYFEYCVVTTVKLLNSVDRIMIMPFGEEGGP